MAAQKETSLRGTKQSHEATANNKQIANKSVITSQPSLRGGTTKQSASLIPKLRFKEFEGEWEIIKFDKYCDFQQGVQVDVDLQKTEPFEDYIRFLRIENYTQESNDFRFIPNIYNESKIINENDIVVVRYGATAGFIGRGKKGVLANNLFKIIPDKSFFDNEYLYHYLKSYKAFHFFQTEMSGGAMPALSFGIVKALKVPISDLVEQQKIANFLTAVDTKLQQLTTKKERLAQYKKGVMQQLFSQQLRFKPDVIARTQDDAISPNETQFPDWEEKKFKEIVVNYRLGGNYENTLEVTSYPLIKMGNLDRGKIKLNKLEYVTSNEEIDSKDKIEYGDLFFNTRNTLDLVGKVAIWRNELPVAYYNSNLMYLKFENNFFMNYRLNSYEGIKGLKRFATGTTSVAAIYTKDLLKLKLKIPSLKEQKKIANYLSAIDLKIEAVQTQITKTQAFKKGLLQAMFV